MELIEDLKSEAASLGIKHNANIGADKLKEKIEAHYTAQETSGPALEAAVKKDEEAATKETAAEVKKSAAKLTKRQQREKSAKKTRVVTIVDNDQRTNNHTTTCTVNCSNEYFDLGTRILPLGEKIEVAQGHLNVLKEVMIPLHARDNKTGLSVAKTRARYSINYEDNQ